MYQTEIFSSLAEAADFIANKDAWKFSLVSVTEILGAVMVVWIQSVVGFQNNS